MPKRSNHSNGAAKRRNGHEGKSLLAWHKLHAGVYARVARQLGVDASYVSRVAKGDRQADHVEQALISELKRIERLRPRV